MDRRDMAMMWLLMAFLAIAVVTIFSAMRDLAMLIIG